MNKLILIVSFLMLGLSFKLQVQLPDLKNPEDLKALGIGRIIEKDGSIITKITLIEVKEYWVVFLKNESLHDITMESIQRIEFKNSKWGPVKIEFTNNKPTVSYL